MTIACGPQHCGSRSISVVERFVTSAQALMSPQRATEAAVPRQQRRLPTSLSDWLALAGYTLRQGDIVHLETTVENLVADGRVFVFYDRNATLAFSKPYTDTDRLDAVAWDLLTESPQLDGFCKCWHNQIHVERYADWMERVQAEFLVREHVELHRLVRVGVVDEARAAEVRGFRAAAGVALPVEVKRDWYFLGQ